MKERNCKLLAKENAFWVLVYSLIFGYFLIRYSCLPLPDGTPNDSAQWVHFKQSIMLPLAILLGAVFVHMFSNPIEPAPTEGMDEQTKAAALAKTQRDMSLQRRNWMIFAYSFMLVALLVPIYLFGPGWDVLNSLSKGTSSDTTLNHPVSIFVGCSENQQKGELNCTPTKEVTPSKPANDGITPASGVPAIPAAKPSDKKTVPAKPASAAVTTPPPEPAITGSAWVLNLGGHVINAKACEPGNGTEAVCQVRGGLLVPIYVIILALVGGSISLTRRLPEYQKCANPEFISTEKESRLTQHEFREYLVFQMVQFISAPLLAILAYFLIDPNNSVASVVLAFSAGFASESILLMVRALTEKFTPSSGVSGSGTLTGIVTQAADGKPVRNAEVALSSSSQLRTVTDAAGFYVLNNVPLGEHGIKVAQEGYEVTTGSVRVERSQDIVRQHWSLKAKT